MPRGRRTGPRGQGTGRRAPGARRGQGTGGGPQSQGRRGFRAGFAGPGGNCICPKCGYKTLHKREQPCYQEKCPECGTPMIREQVAQAQ